MAKLIFISRLHVVTLFLALLGTCQVYGQTASGFMPLNRLGVSYQKAIGIDVGLGSYNMLFGRKKASFFDVSLGVESIFAERFALVPKVNLDVGFPIWPLDGLAIGGGLDVGGYTDFSRNSLRITPKVGFIAGTVIRLYYGYHYYSHGPLPERTGRHRVSLEFNIAAFHDFKIGI